MLLALEFFDLVFSMIEALLELGLAFVEFGGVLGLIKRLLVLLFDFLLRLGILELSSQEFYE